MSHTVANSGAFIEKAYDDVILTNLQELLIPEIFYRNVSAFGSGTTIDIKTLGAVSLQEVTSDKAVPFSQLDSNTIQLVINEYVGRAWAITDELREDGVQVEALESQNLSQTTYEIAKYFETKLYEAAFNAVTIGDPNEINGFAHMRVGSGANNTLSDADLIEIGLAFDKANVPYQGRVGIVSPVVARTLERQVGITAGVNRNPMFQNILETGFTNTHRFVMHLHGFDLWTSNLLPSVAAGTNVDGTNTIANEGVANIFMSLAGDAIKPLMAAWRRMSRTESRREINPPRDEYITTARFGVGVQRVDTLAAIVTDAKATA